MIFVTIIIICRLCLTLNFSLSVLASLFICLKWNYWCHWSEGDQLEKRWFKREYYIYFGNFTMILVRFLPQSHLKSSNCDFILKRPTEWCWSLRHGLSSKVYYAMELSWVTDDTGLIIINHCEITWIVITIPAKGISLHSDVICNIFSIHRKERNTRETFYRCKKTICVQDQLTS